MKVFDAIASAVAAEETEVVFTVMDDVTLPLVQVLYEQGVRVIRARHEQSAVVMADGYARATGRPGVCTVGAGPALAQTGTGLVTARKRGSPVVVVAGDMPAADRSNAKVFDQRRYVEATAGQFVPVRSATTVAEDVQQAFRFVRSGRGPAVLNVPKDILESEYPWEWQYLSSATTMPGSLRLAPDSDAVARAAAMLATVRRPVILMGKGAVVSEARGEIEALASRIGALLGTTLQAREYLRGHPFHIGVVGTFATGPAVELLAQADCILAVGATLNPYTTGGGRIAPRAKVIHIDQNPTHIGEFTPVDVGIVGDARTALSAINHCLDTMGISERASYWSGEHVRAQIQACRLRPPPTKAGPPGPPSVTQVLAELDKLLPRDRMVVLDGGLVGLFVFDGISVPGPEACVWGGLDFASIGLGLALGIGAAQGRPDRHTVVFVGDGSLMMTVHDLETAVRERIPMTVVVLNDGAYGAEVKKLEERNKPSTLALFDNPAFAEVARAFGARGMTVRALDELRTAAELMGKEERPFVMDIKIARQVHHRVFGSA